jgi:hypothetical protein
MSSNGKQHDTDETIAALNPPDWALEAIRMITRYRDELFQPGGRIAEMHRLLVEIHAEQKAARHRAERLGDRLRVVEAQLKTL